MHERPYFIPVTNGAQPFTAQDLVPPPAVDPSPPPGLRGGPRKIAIVGSAPSASAAPWYDPSWEIWGHATHHSVMVRCDRYFDVHPWSWFQAKAAELGKGYLRWLAANLTPIYLAEKQATVPASRRYPIERIRAEFPYTFASHTAYMVALALTEGVTSLGFFGIHYAFGSEYEKQRPNAEFWVGVAVGRGVQIVIPDGSPLCHEPKGLYGYETHTGADAVARLATRHANRREMGVEPNVITPDGPAAHPELVAMGIAKAVDRQRGEVPRMPNGDLAWTDDPPASN